MSVIVWSKVNCPQCEQAKSLLAANGFEYEERKIGDGWTKEDLLAAVPTARAVPQIFINDQHIGSFKELKLHLNK